VWLLYIKIKVFKAKRKASPRSARAGLVNPFPCQTSPDRHRRAVGADCAGDWRDR